MPVTPVKPHASIRDLVDVKEHLLNPKLFSDPDVYRAEMERIMLHSWLYVGHEQQLQGGPGSFITAYMGEDGVIVCRDSENRLRVYLNSCPHRGMKLCVVDSGKAKKFQCPFHAWTFNIDGELIAVPALKEAYNGDLNLDRWGLIEVPKVSTYRGLIFASFDPGIESLEDYLGEAKWYLDMVLNRTPGGIQLLPGTHKWTYNANWKMLAENLAGDNAHVPYTHGCMLELAGIVGDSIDFGGNEPWKQSFLTRTDKGHGFITIGTDDSAFVGAELQRQRKTVKEMAHRRLDPVQAQAADAIRTGTIFPNFGFIESYGWCVIRVYHPRGPGKTEVWSWMITDSEITGEALEESRASFILQYSPSGIVESDDTEMWVRCQEATSAPYRRRFPLNYQAGKQHGRKDPERPGLIHRPPTEIGSFGFYEQWQELMAQGEGEGV